jgi:protein TonB
MSKCYFVFGIAWWTFTQKLVATPLPNNQSFAMVSSQFTAKIDSPVVVPPPVVEEEKEGVLIHYIEILAKPKGGLQQFYKYIKRNLRYPKLGYAAGLEGKVYLRFIVETDGSISNIEVLRGIRQSFDEEAVRLLKAGPIWVPKQERGRAVRSRISLPVVFRLE